MRREFSNYGKSAEPVSRLGAAARIALVAVLSLATVSAQEMTQESLKTVNLTEA